MSRSAGPVVDVAALEEATMGLPAPLVTVELDAFGANADDLAGRASGRPIRVASKSVRCRPLLRQVLDRPGFAGVWRTPCPRRSGSCGRAPRTSSWPTRDLDRRFADEHLTRVLGP